MAYVQRRAMLTADLVPGGRIGRRLGLAEGLRVERRLSDGKLLRPPIPPTVRLADFWLSDVQHVPSMQRLGVLGLQREQSL